MHETQTHNLTGYALIIAGSAFLLKAMGVISAPDEMILSYLFMLYGILIVYFCFGSPAKASLFTGSVSFFVGVALFITNNFEITSPNLLAFPTLLLILVMSFLMMYIDSPKNRVFLYSSLLLATASAAAILLLKDTLVFGFINHLLASYYPAVLIITGLAVMLDRKETDG